MSNDHVHPIFRPILAGIASEDPREQCACGLMYEPVDEHGEDADCCKRCAENRAEAAYDRYQERCMEDPPISLDEQHRAAWEEKRRLK